MLPDNIGIRSALKLGHRLITSVHQRTVDAAAGLKISIACKLKIKAILAGRPSIRPFQFTKKLLKDYGDTRWHQAYYSANGITSDNYVPEDIFYVNIEAKLNPIARRQFYSDKNCFDKLRFPCTFPRTLGRIVKGKFLSASYHRAAPIDELAGFPLVVVKPSLETGGGKNVEFMTGADVVQFALASMRGRPSEEYIFQEPIQQSFGLSRFAPDSVNTIRIMTMIRNGLPQAVSSVLRMGRMGSKVDNQARGGISCGITNGYLIANAYDKAFTAHQKHPDTGIRFEKFRVPGYQQAADVCVNAHSLMPEIGIVSWDVAIDKNDNPIVVEMNLDDQEINFHQLAHGPLFGDQIACILRETRPFVILDHPVG